MQSAQPTPVDVFLRTHPDRGGLRVQVGGQGDEDRGDERTHGGEDQCDLRS